MYCVPGKYLPFVPSCLYMEYVLVTSRFLERIFGILLFFFKIYLVDEMIFPDVCLLSCVVFESLRSLLCGSILSD